MNKKRSKQHHAIKHPRSKSNRTLAGRLYIRRSLLDLSCAAVAGKAGITPASYSRYESGLAKDMHASAIFALANALECDVRWLWVGKT